MLYGDRAVFGIEVSPQMQIGDKVYGSFFLWLDGKRLGDPSDAALLKACRNWLADLDPSAQMRREPRLDVCDAEAVLRFGSDEVMARSGVSNPRFPDAFRRFHVSHIGMSAFDRFDVLLLLTAAGENRFVWRLDGGEARECCVDVELVREVVNAAVAGMDRLFSNPTWPIRPAR